MTVCYFAFFFNPTDPSMRIDPAEGDALRDCIIALPGLERAHLYTPAAATDRFSDDGAPPILGLQLYFTDIMQLEAAITPGGALHDLVKTGGLSSLDGTAASQQAMYLRPFDVCDPAPLSPSACSYIVYYPGPAEDLNGWLGCYIRQHPPIMKKFPGLRELEILTRMDWVDAMPWPRADIMQRNRVMFDSPQALTDALHSEVRVALRDDSATFPPIQNGNKHYPMLTDVLLPGA